MSATGLTKVEVAELGNGAVVLDSEGLAWQRSNDDDGLWLPASPRHEPLTDGELYWCRPLTLAWDGRTATIADGQLRFPAVRR